MPTAMALEVLEGIHSPELGNQRDVLVYLPPSYHRGDRSYPVLYMQDGQNLFDPSTSFAGEWGVGRAMNAAAPPGCGGDRGRGAQHGRRAAGRVLAVSRRGRRAAAARARAYADFLARHAQAARGRAVPDPPRAGRDRGRRLVDGRAHQPGRPAAPSRDLRRGRGARAHRCGSPAALSSRRSNGRRSCPGQDLPRYRGAGRPRGTWPTPAGCGISCCARATVSGPTSAGSSPARGRHDERSWGRRFARALPFLLGRA